MYFKAEEIAEALEIVVNAKSDHINIELHNIAEETDIPKTMLFYRDPTNNAIGVLFFNEIDDEDPTAVENFEFAIQVVKDHITDLAIDLSFRPFNRI